MVELIMCMSCAGGDSCRRPACMMAVLDKKYRSPVTIFAAHVSETGRRSRHERMLRGSGTKGAVGRFCHQIDSSKGQELRASVSTHQFDPGTLEQRARPFLTLSTIQRRLREQRPDPFTTLDGQLQRFTELDRWRDPDGIDLDPYARVLSSSRIEARRAMTCAPQELVPYVRAATRLSELLLRLAGDREGPPTQRSANERLAG